MDNSLVHIPVRSFLNAICKVVIADLVLNIIYYHFGLKNIHVKQVSPYYRLPTLLNLDGVCTMY